MNPLALAGKKAVVGKKKSSLSGKLTRYFLWLTASLLLLNAGVLTYISFVEQERALHRAQQATAEKVALTVPDYIEGLMEELEQGAAFSRLARLQSTAQQTALDELLKSYPEASRMVIYDRSSKQLAEASRSWVTPSGYAKNLTVAREAQFSALQGDRYASNVYIGVASGSNENHPYIMVAVPLRDQGQITGILSAELDLSRMWTIVAKTRLGEQGYVYVADNNGNLIAHPNPYQVLLQNELGDLPKPLQTALSTPDKTKSALPKPNKAIQLESSDLGNSSQVMQQEYIGLDGKRVVGTFVQITDLGWWVVLEMPSSEAYASLNHLLVLAGVLFFVATALALIFGRYLSNQITRPILELEQGTSIIGGGDLNHVIQVQTDDEIGVLANAFNTMADRLRGLVMGLEQTVDQRTAELAQAVDQAEDTLAYLTAIINNIADGMLVTDMEGKVTQFNPALPSLFDLKTKDPIGQDCQTLFGSVLSNLMSQTRQTPQAIFTAEIALTGNRTGKAVATAIRKEESACSSGRGELLGSVILIRDITADKEVDKMKTDFISTVSHELRTPLTSVLGFAKIIKKKLGDTVFPLVQSDEKKVQRTIRQIDDNLDIILSEGERLTTLINDVLDIAKMEAGKIDWRMEPLQISEVLDRSLAATTALFENKGLQLVKEVEAGLPEVLGDRDRLIQVVINLISNAVKFTDQGAVTCAIQQIDQSVRVSVADQGIGIAEADLAKVFEKFKQVGDTLTDKPKGTGLGLPICKQIIEHHGGSIWVESQLGQGSTFFFTLPLTPVPETETPRITLGSLLSKLRDQVSGQLITTTGERKKVLVIDDDPNIRELLRQQLEAEGYTVQEAKDGIEGITLVKQFLPDLIILDVMMPEMSGFDVAAVLKNDPQTMGIPIIINSIIEDKARGYRLGVDRYLTKPTDPEELLREVSSLLSQGSSTKKVLVVDENASTAKTLSEVLQAKGYSVVEAVSDPKLLETAISAQPDMIIVNANLSEQQNIVRALRFEKGLEHVFFLLLTQDQDTNGSDQS